MLIFLMVYFFGNCVAQNIDTNEIIKIEKTRHLNNCIECDDNPDEYLTTPEIIRRHGYTSESHVIQTFDGYLLELHRIPVNKNGKRGIQPVFLQHGLLSSSADWVDVYNCSLAFILSDLGYDVWLGNARGNTYSRGHVLYPPNSDQYWNFSFHEMGIYDLPAALGYVSNITEKGGEIIYIGHSMGTTMFFVFASTMPQFATKTVTLMVALAPVAYSASITSPIRYLAPWINDLEWLAKHLGIREFLPNNEVMKILSYECERLNIERYICENVIFAICGFDKDQFNEKFLPVILAHAPAGSSTKTIIHYAQEINHNGDFIQFDYGKARNLVIYGNSTPPPYNLQNINVSTYFMYGNNDWLADPMDVFHLTKKVKKILGVYEVPLKTFNHVDFLWAKDAYKLVYSKLITVIQRHG